MKKCPHCGIELDSETTKAAMEFLGLKYDKCWRCWRSEGDEKGKGNEENTTDSR